MVGGKVYTPKIFTVMSYSGIYVDGTPYIRVGDLSFASSTFPILYSIFRTNGERLDVNSQEYKKVVAALGGGRTLWTRPPQSERPIVADFDELKIELDSEGFIAKPEWMKELVDDSRYPLPDEGTGYGITYFQGILVGDASYIETGIGLSSNLCTATQIYRLNGERLECDSPEYNEVVFGTKKEIYGTLWLKPLRE